MRRAAEGGTEAVAAKEGGETLDEIELLSFPRSMSTLSEE